MAYKTILVHADETASSDTRVEFAARLALTENAHLIGAAMTGVSRFLYDTISVDAGAPNIEPYLDTLRQRADERLVRFETVVQRVGVASYEKRRSDDEAAGAISMQARYCDLVVLGQFNSQDNTPTDAGLPQYVAMNSACPVLVHPYEKSFPSVGNRVLVAWNASTESARAVRHALPLLKKAKIVELVIFNPDTVSQGTQPGDDIALFLARHDVKVNVMQEKTNTDVGSSILALADGLNSDLLVMGCYGHSRFREVLMGGATRSVLRAMKIPVLMAH
jgi:nucleotide-binding universal stress UspA family protein